MVTEIMAGGDADEMLVPLRGGGAGRPLLLTHGGDLVVGLPALARRLGTDRPVFGLRPQLAPPSSGRVTVEGIAAELVAAVREADPRGPYLLVGICSGGPIALEMARLLTTGGEGVEQLVLIDPRVRPHRSIRYLAWRAAIHARRGSLPAAVAEKVRGTIGRASSVAGGRVPDFYRRLSAVREAYEVRPLAGVRATLIASEDYDVALSVPASTWCTALPDGFVKRRIPFSHETLMFPPAIDTLASELDDLTGTSAP
jgi:thioesterase domain-containing protein